MACVLACKCQAAPGQNLRFLQTALTCIRKNLTLSFSLCAFYRLQTDLHDDSKEPLLINQVTTPSNPAKSPQSNPSSSPAAPAVQVLQFCLAYGADPHRATDGVLPTEAAAATGALQALAMLLRIGAVPGAGHGDSGEKDSTDGGGGIKRGVPHGDGG